MRSRGGVHRIGQGFDVHRLVTGRPLRLGGVPLESNRGPSSHSDGDVLLHAVVNALLGAIGAGDLGAHFPDTDPRFRGIDSATLVSEAMVLVRRDGYRVANLDSTVLAESPRLAPHRSSMEARIAELLGIDSGRVNVKFGTGETVGPVGRHEAIEAQAIVLLVRDEG
ncbi:MAG: 2-C-methyl-D-erythritol 2,4-cyclodiphosphate synthase [Actinomycetota bacterium]